MNDGFDVPKDRHNLALSDRRGFLAAGVGLAVALLSNRLTAGGPIRQAEASDGKTREMTHPIRIGIIGAGWLGGTVGRLWVKAGHEVMFSSRHPQELASLVRDLGPRATVGTPNQAAEFATVLLFAVPYEALPQLGRDLREAIRGKIVLDACNPSSGEATLLAREAQTNGVAETSAKYLQGTRYVRGFSAVDATAVEASASRMSSKLGVPLASEDEKAVQVAAQLVRDAGCEPVVVGNLAAARSFQRGGRGFRANATAQELRRLIGL